MEEIELRLNKYFVTTYRLDRKLESVETPFDAGNFKFHFEREVKEHGNDIVLISLSFVHDKDDKNPFDMKITVNGIFEMAKWKSTREKRFIMIENTTSILFPYLRNLVSDMTSNALGSPYILPVMNTFALFNSKQ